MLEIDHPHVETHVKRQATGKTLLINHPPSRLLRHLPLPHTIMNRSCRENPFTPTISRRPRPPQQTPTRAATTGCVSVGSSTSHEVDYFSPLSAEDLTSLQKQNKKITPLMMDALQDIEDVRGPPPKPDDGRWIPVVTAKRRRKRRPTLAIAYEKTTVARLVPGPAPRKGSFLHAPPPPEEIKIDARDAARRLRESRKSRREKHGHQRATGEVSHGRRMRRGKDHDRLGERIPWTQDHGDRLEEATFSAPYPDPEFLAKFNSTLGYPGEGPPLVTTFTKCAHGASCTKRSHFHRKRGGAAGSSAERGFKERNKKGDPLTADKVTKCEYALTDFHCASPGCHFHGTPGMHMPKHLDPIKESLAALPAGQPLVRTEATKTPITPVVPDPVPSAPPPEVSFDSKHSPPQTPTAPTEDQLTDKAPPLSEVEAVLPVVVTYPPNEAWTSEPEPEEVEIDICASDFIYTHLPKVKDRSFFGKMTREEYCMIHVDDPEIEDKGPRKKRDWMLARRTPTPVSIEPPVPPPEDGAVPPPPPPATVHTAPPEVPPPPPEEEEPVPPPPVDDTSPPHSIAERIIFYTAEEKDSWYYIFNRALFAAARPFAATRLAVKCDDAKLLDVVAVNYQFKVAVKDKRGYVSKWTRSVETCFLESCKFKFHRTEDVSLTLVDYVQKDTAFLNTTVFDAAGAVLPSIDTRVRGIVSTALIQLALTHSPPPPDVVQSTVLYLTQWKYFSGFKTRLGTVRGVFKPDFHQSGHVLESNSVTRSGYLTSRQSSQLSTRTR